GYRDWGQLRTQPAAEPDIPEPAHGPGSRRRLPRFAGTPDKAVFRRNGKKPLRAPPDVNSSSFCVPPIRRMSAVVIIFLCPARRRFTVRRLLGSILLILQTLQPGFDLVHPAQILVVLHGAIFHAHGPVLNSAP